MSEPVLKVNVDDPSISVLTLNRPEKRNALNVELIEKVTDAVIVAAADPNRRAIILAGEGPAFCAGLDMTEASVPGGAEKSAEALARMYDAIGNCPVVTIAAAHGAAMGGGAGLLAACDFVVAADDLKLAYPEVRRGLVARVDCNVFSFVARLSDGRARELILLGQESRNRVSINGIGIGQSDYFTGRPLRSGDESRPRGLPWRAGAKGILALHKAVARTKLSGASLERGP